MAYVKENFPKGGNIKTQWDKQEIKLKALEAEVDAKVAGFNEIEEFGEDEHWHWIKYRNGEMRMYGRVPWDTPIQSGWGTVFYSPSAWFEYPVRFTYGPESNVQYVPEGGGEAWATANANSATKASEDFELHSPSSYGNVRGHLHFIVFGHWK